MGSEQSSSGALAQLRSWSGTCGSSRTLSGELRLLKYEVTNRTGGLEGSQQRVTNGNQSYHQGFQLFGIGL